MTTATCTSHMHIWHPPFDGEERWCACGARLLRLTYDGQRMRIEGDGVERMKVRLRNGEMFDAATATSRPWRRT